MTGSNRFGILEYTLIPRCRHNLRFSFVFIIIIILHRRIYIPWFITVIQLLLAFVWVDAIWLRFRGWLSFVCMQNPKVHAFGCFDDPCLECFHMGCFLSYVVNITVRTLSAREVEAFYYSRPRLHSVDFTSTRSVSDPANAAASLRVHAERVQTIERFIIIDVKIHPIGIRTSASCKTKQGTTSPVNQS